MLEHTIASIVLKLAYLASGLLLAYLGKDLLEKGVRGSFAGEGQVASTRLRLVTSSPGVVFLVAGLGIVLASVFTRAEYWERTDEVTRSSRFVQPAPTGAVEPPPADRDDDAMMNMLRYYVVLRDRPVAHSPESLGFPDRPGVESKEDTARRLESSIENDPASTLALLQDSRYRWISKDEFIATSLKNKLRGLLANANVNNAH